jgi:hypothetical protein
MHFLFGILSTKKKEGRENENGIIGDAPIEHLNHSFEELIGQSCEIRTKLGNQAYLLDKYLSYLFESTNRTQVYVAASDGFDTAGELNGLCYSVIRDDPKYKDHPFYEQVKAYIDAHPLKHQEPHTKVPIYCSALAGDFLKYSAEKYFDKIKSDSVSVLDICNLCDLYDKICGLLGSEETMENLNLLFQQRFLITTAMAAFLQGMTNQLLYSLTYRDRESSKQIFQLILDERTSHSAGEQKRK